MPVPDYSPGERLADGAIHAIGVTASIAAAALLLVTALVRHDLSVSGAIAAYGATLVTALALSAAYNLVRAAERREKLRRLDHAAIFLLIAGTYTPFILVGLDNAAGRALLAGVWAVALIGATLKLALPRRLEGVSIVLYLALGWAGLVIVDDLVASLPTVSLMLLGVGGALYTIGVVFHLWRHLRYHNALWHAFVLAGAACHCVAIWALLEAG